MYRATCLASSVLPAQTAIKHLLGSMQLISSNNKMSQWSRESGFDCHGRCGDRMTTSCREKRDVFILLASCGTCVHHLSLPLFLSQGNVLYESKYRSYEF